MAAHVKKEDPNHMLTVGEEGFYSKASCSAAVNPGSWADASSGQNSKLNHALINVDFVSFHLWPDNWNQVSLEFATEWITQHVQDAWCAYATTFIACLLTAPTSMHISVVMLHTLTTERPDTAPLPYPLICQSCAFMG